MELTPEEQALITKQRQKQEEEKARAEWQPRPLNSYTPEEKITWFNNQYSQALQEFEEAKQNNRHDEDGKQYTWEIFMQLLAHKNDTQTFWKVWNYFVR